ncbi:MAG: SDR family NAD(P)-dependent oxidoreductase [Bacillota bacterium]
MVLKDKVALITGAGRGIGKGVALRFAREGCSVVCCDIDRELAIATASEIERIGAGSVSLQIDVASDTDAKAAVNEAISSFGHLDIVANIAGISPKRDGRKIPFHEIPVAQWDRVLAVNLTGCFLLSSAAAPYMIAQGSGRIINMSSIAAKTGNGGPAGAHYSASKAGVISLTRSMARELAPFGITVNAVAPGRIATAMMEDTAKEVNSYILASIPMGRFGTVDEVVEVFVFLASDAASYITGETIDVNGGWLID